MGIIILFIISLSYHLTGGVAAGDSNDNSILHDDQQVDGIKKAWLFQNQGVLSKSWSLPGVHLAGDNGLPDVRIESLVRQWAPLVWLAPGEEFFPDAVPEFLPHVTPRTRGRRSSSLEMPVGRSSEYWYLVTKTKLENLLKNDSSFIYGRNPYPDPVPVYALVTLCANTSNDVYQDDVPYFHVTYWMFYPYSQGKSLCTVDTGLFGVWPIPLINTYCMGSYREFGSHVGDWEHMSLIFKGHNSPDAMYVSAHDAGAFYRYEPKTRRFNFERQEVRRGVLQRPTFPPTVQLTHRGDHPVLFAAKGSHGLWTAPGKHKFVRIPRLYDVSGYGIPWATWKHVDMLFHADHPSVLSSTPDWMKYRGHWGNPRSKCHPLSRVGLHICQFTDGPQGIPTKKENFQCPKI